MTIQKNNIGDTFYVPDWPSNKPHEKRFARLLEIVYNPESNESKLKADELVKHDSRLLQAGRITGDEFKKRRELLKSTANGDAAYISDALMATVVEGAEKKQIMRKALNVLPVKATSPTVTSTSPSGVVEEVSDVAEFPDSGNVYSRQTVTVRKYGEKNIISRELLEDGHFDTAALEASRSGAKIENTLNHVTLTALLDGAEAEHDCVGANHNMLALMTAKETINKNGYDADTSILCYYADYLVRSSNYTIDPTQPRILGMDLYTYEPADTTYNSDTHTWGYDHDDEIGMLVLDSNNLCAFLGMRRDLHFENYDDPIRDLGGAAVSIRFGVGVPNADGICKVIY